MPFVDAESRSTGGVQKEGHRKRAIGPASDREPLAAAEPDQGSRRRRWRIDLAVSLAYLTTAIYVTADLWVDPGGRVVAGVGGVDQQFFEFVMAHGAHVLTDLQNPLFTDRLNAPMGVNMMANTSVLGMSIPLAPVTLLFGPHITVLVAMVLSLAGTAAAWYWLLSRHVVSNRFAAFVAGGFCGFAPAMLSQAVGHPNFIAQFLIPLIGWRVIKLAEPGRAVRNGLILGLLVVWQAFLNEEFLLFAAIGCLCFVVTWALAHRAEVRARFTTFVAGLGVATAFGVVALAYPLYFQFFGRQSYDALPFTPSRFYADLYSYFLFSSESLAGDRAIAKQYALNPSEENTFLGWPLMLLVAVLAVWLWRNVVARAALVIAVVFGSISLGNEIVIAKHGTGIPGPYRYLSHLPLIDMSIPSRYALMVVPMVAILLALATERITTTGFLRFRPSRRLRLAWYAVLVAALLPIAPTPLWTQPAQEPPHFITSGAWRPYVEDGGTLVPVPLPSSKPSNISTMRWSSFTGLDFAVPGGYFIGPSGENDRSAIFTSPPRPTSSLLDTVARRGVVLSVGNLDRQAAVEDLKFWRASVVVLGKHPHEAELLDVLQQLLGPAQRVDDVWLWDVRGLTR
jgi:hypothetical protein